VDLYFAGLQKGSIKVARLQFATLLPATLPPVQDSHYQEIDFL
jgi:hypothetical protein